MKVCVLSVWYFWTSKLPESFVRYAFLNISNGRSMRPTGPIHPIFEMKSIPCHYTSPCQVSFKLEKLRVSFETIDIKTDRHTERQINTYMRMKIIPVQNSFFGPGKNTKTLATRLSSAQRFRVCAKCWYSTSFYGLRHLTNILGNGSPSLFGWKYKSPKVQR